MTSTLVFDIETVPDVEGLRRIHALPQSLSDGDVLDWALREGAGLRVASVGVAGDSEAELIRRFFDLVDKHTLQLVSWNGGGFDLPVLNYRALIHGVPAARFWDWG